MGALLAEASMGAEELRGSPRPRPSAPLMRAFASTYRLADGSLGDRRPIRTHLLERVTNFVRIARIVFFGDMVHEDRFLDGVVSPPVQHTGKDPQHLAVKLRQADELPSKRPIGVGHSQAYLQRALDHKPLVVLPLVC